MALTGQGLDFSVQGVIAQGGAWELLAVTTTDGTHTRFLLKRLKSQAAAEDAVGLRNDWEIVSRCRLGCMLEPLEFLSGGPDSAILFRSVEGTLAAPSGHFDNVLDAADAVARALGEVHAAGIIHGDLQPEHLLFVPDRVYLIDFSGARSTPRDQRDIESVWSLRRNLNYIAPEQTGRLNRAADYRADYYSFGVILYQWLTGRLPFSADHPLELVFAHLTLEPPRPDRIRLELPPFLSDVAMKLLAKEPDRRYQSIEGLRADLEIARGRGPRIGSETSEVGAYDVPYHFAVTHKLYGRETEREVLLKSYDRACRGEREMILIAGYSGIGKTSLIRETYIPVTRQKAYFVAGKFDQLQRTRPYSAWIEALRKLMMQVLAEPEQQLTGWQHRIGKTLGANAGVLAPMVPELATLLGPLEPPPELPPSEALYRFNDSFRRFLGCFCQPEQPLAVFLDNLQWIDGASLNLLELLLRDPDLRYLFPIGAYRDNEVGPGHPLLLALDRLKREGVFTLTELTLRPLDDSAVAGLVADTFALPVLEANPLAAVLSRTTAGNPFFLWQMLQALRSRGEVRFDRTTLRWTWNPEAIERLPYADNVLDLMQARFQELPEETRGALALAACLGSRFDLETLGVLCGKEPHEVLRRLQAAREAEFIVPEAPLEIRSSHLVIPRLRFLHDRLQEAAYRSIPADRVAATHQRIARLLMADAGVEPADERIFEIADHLNRANCLVVTRHDGLQLARVNLSAARRARAAAAYDAALRYAKFAMAQLPEDLWDTERELARALFRSRGELEYLNGRFEPAEQFVRTAIAKETDRLQRADLLHMLVVQYTLRALYPEAIETAREGLRLLGVELPECGYEQARDEELERVLALLGDRPLSTLAELPAMEDPEQRMVMTLLTALGPPCYRSHPGLWSVIVVQEVRRCLEYGNVASASYTYPAFGGLLVHVGRGSGRDCAVLHEVTARLMARFDVAADTSVGYLMMGSSLTHWFAPLSEATRDYLNAYRTGLDSGNLQYAAYALGHNTYCRFYQGVPLADLMEEAQGYLEFCQRRGNLWGIDLNEGALRVFATLHGADGGDGFAWGGEPEAAYLARCASHRNLQVLCIYHLLKAEALWHLGRLHEAAASLLEAESGLDSVSVPGLLPASQIHLLRALLLAHSPEMLGVPEQDARREIASIRQQFERWAKDCPAGFGYLCRLIRAEEARMNGDVTDALEAYDGALDAACEQGLQQRAGLIAVRAALFWNGRGKRYFAEVYRRRAEFAYQAWQAGSVLRKRGNGFWSALAGPTESGAAWMVSARELDQQALLAAAQAFCQPLSLDELVHTILLTASQMSGAQRTVLILQSAMALTVVADSADAGVPASGRLLDQVENLPRSVLNYVARSRSVWRLTDAEHSTDTLHLQDDYFRQTQPSSALCLPLLYLGELGGLLYLEQFELGDAFDARHTQTLEFTAGQAAIALRNARLFDALQREIGERKLAENALRESERRFRAILDNTPALIFIKDLEGRYLLMNRSCAEITGTDEQRVQGKTTHELFPAGIADTLVANDQRLLVHRGCQQVEELLPVNGMLHTFLSTQFPLQDSDGRTYATCGISTDITERKRMEEALATSEQEFRLLAEAMPQIVWITRPDGWNIYFNQQWVDYTGLTLAESYGAGWNKPFHPDDQQRAWDAWQNAVNHLATYSLECRLRRFDGQYRWWLIRGVPVFDGDGKIVKWFGTCTDIDDLKRAEHQVKESEQKFKWMTDTSPLAIYMSSGIEQKAEYVNPTFVDLFGYTLDEVPTAARWWPLALPDAAYRIAFIEQWQRRVGLAIETRSTIEPMEVVVTCKDGSKKNILWSFTSAGVQNWAFGLDLTERKRAEEQLLEAKRAAEAASEAKSRFLATMSHEIRTPLNAVFGLTQLALQTPLTERQRDYLRKIDSAGQGLRSIINDILDISKIESGKLTLDSGVFRLTPLVAELESQVRMGAVAKGLAFRTVLGEAFAAPLRGDAMRLRQVLLNLLGNAVKFTSAGEVVLEITREAAQDGREHLCFEVRDTGIGMSEEEQASLFQPFGQVDSSITRRYGGTGLGLAICRQLVERMGGTIGVWSAPGQGSAFRVSLAFEPGDEAAVEAPAADAGLQVAVKGLAGCRVLLVEDNPLNRQVAREILQKLGVEVEEADDGAAAVELVRRSRYDAVLMDIHMPGMDGYEATRRIRRMRGTKHLPIIALTADAFSGDRDKCLECGMNDHLAKPFELTRLVDVLLRRVKGRAEPLRSGGAPVSDARQPCVPEPPGVELAGTLRRLGNDAALYRRALASYLQRHAGTPLRLCELLAAGNFDELRLLAHSLKSEAGTVGVTAVADAARMLDAAIKAGARDRLQTLTDALAKALERSTPELQAWFGADAAIPEPASAVPDGGDLPTVLRALGEHLTNNNLDARRDFDCLAALLTAPEDRSLLQRLGALIAEMAFAEALEVLREEVLRRGLAGHEAE